MKRLLNSIFLPLFLLAAGILLIVFGVKQVNDYNKFTPAQAQIVDIDFEYDAAREEKEYTVIVKYSIDGEEYQAELGQYKATYEIGQTVNIRYNPLNPAKIMSGDKSSLVIMFAFGGFVLLAGVGTLIKKIR